MSAPFLLFKFPSRGRPERFFTSLDSIVNALYNNTDYHVAATLDEDDAAMQGGDVRDRLATYRNLSVAWGKSDSKVHAINRDMPDIPWDICICMSDDMVFIQSGFDDIIRKDMQEFFPEMDGLLHYPDRDAKSALATMYIAGRKFYDRFGYIYNPAFKSLWCDNLVQDISQRLGKYKYIEKRILDHLNPAYGHYKADDMFLRQQKDWYHDEKTYNEIKERGYDMHLLKP